MLEALKETVCEANLELSRRGVVLYTWGNVSGIDRARGLVVIKPSGVPYQGMQPSDMVVVDLEGHIWNCIRPFRRSAASSIRIPPMPWFLRRRAWKSRHLEPRMQTIFMEPSP